MNQKKGKGDCFSVAADTILDLSNRGKDNETYKLVHGIALGTGGEAAGLRFTHAWIEVNGNFVLDFSNGHSAGMFIDDYYSVGNIDKDLVRKYTPKEMMKLMYDTGNYGPWDEIFDDYL